MSEKRLTRRDLLRSAFVGSAGLMLAACQPKIVEVTKIVEKEVEKVVKETVVVKEAVEVEKEVTRVVEKEVEKKVEVEKEVTRIVEKQVKAPEEPITLVFQHCYRVYDNHGKENVNPEFEDKYPNIKIKNEITSGWTSKLFPKITAMHVAGQPWDVAYVPAQAGMEQALYAKGLFRDLEPFVNLDKYPLDKMYPVAVKGGRVNHTGILFGLPLQVDPGLGGVLYNKELFDRAGVPEPTEDWVWTEEWQEALIKLKEELNPTGESELWNWEPRINNGFGFQAVLDAWDSRIMDETGRKLLIDEGKAKDCIKWHYDLMENGIVPRVGSQAGGGQAGYIAGRVALQTVFQPDAPLVIEGAKENGVESGATLMPKGPGPSGRNGGSANPHYICMHSSTKYPEETWEYMKLYVDEKWNEYFWDQGSCPPWKSAWHDPKLVGRLKLYQLDEKLLHTVDFSIPWNLRGRELEDTLYGGMGAIWLGKVGFEEGLDKVCVEVRKVLEKPMIT